MWSSSSRPGACCKNQPPQSARIRALPPGDLGEWFKPAVLKTADGQPSVSSNLTVSAKSSAEDVRGSPSSPPFHREAGFFSSIQVRAKPLACDVFIGISDGMRVIGRFQGDTAMPRLAIPLTDTAVRNSKPDASKPKGHPPAPFLRDKRGPGPETLCRRFGAGVWGRRAPYKTVYQAVPFDTFARCSSCFLELHCFGLRWMPRLRSIGAATPIPTTRVRVARRLMRRPPFLTFKAQKQNSFTSAQASRESSFGPLSHAIRVGGLWTVQNAFP